MEILLGEGRVLNVNSLLEYSGSLKQEMCLLRKDCLSRFSVEKYIGYIDQYPKISSYDYVGNETKVFRDNLLSCSGKKMLEIFHKIVLIDLVIRARQSGIVETFPKEVQLLFIKNFERIVSEIISGDYLGEYDYSNDKFCKDIAVCSMRMIPVGARKIHLQSLSKQFLFRKKPAQFFRGISFVVTELGGFSPLFEMHTDSKDPDLLAEFNEDGTIQTYKRVAELLKEYKYENVKGVFGASWFNDPALEVVSPRLAYIRKIVTSNGGKIFYLGSNKHAIKDATLKSPTRRKLYREGKYLPTSYLLVWSRGKLLRWAEKS